MGHHYPRGNASRNLMMMNVKESVRGHFYSKDPAEPSSLSTISPHLALLHSSGQVYGCLPQLPCKDNPLTWSQLEHIASVCRSGSLCLIYGPLVRHRLDPLTIRQASDCVPQSLGYF